MLTTEERAEAQRLCEALKIHRWSIARPWDSVRIVETDAYGNTLRLVAVLAKTEDRLENAEVDAVDILAARDLLPKALAHITEQEAALAELRRGTNLWECPDCGFSFPAEYEDDKPGGGCHCPNCAETRLEAALRCSRLYVSAAVELGEGGADDAEIDLLAIDSALALASTPATSAYAARVAETLHQQALGRCSR